MMYMNTNRHSLGGHAHFVRQVFKATDECEKIPLVSATKQTNMLISC